MQAACTPNLYLVALAEMPAKCMDARLARTRRTTTVRLCLQELDATLAGVAGIGFLVLDAQLLVRCVVAQQPVCDLERLECVRGVRSGRGEGPRHFSVNACAFSRWPSRAMPWQAEQQPLLVEGLALTPDRLQEGSSAHA